MLKINFDLMLQHIAAVEQPTGVVNKKGDPIYMPVLNDRELASCMKKPHAKQVYFNLPDGSARSVGIYRILSNGYHAYDKCEKSKNRRIITDAMHAELSVITLNALEDEIARWEALNPKMMLHARVLSDLDLYYVPGDNKATMESFCNHFGEEMPIGADGWSAQEVKAYWYDAFADSARQELLYSGHPLVANSDI